MERRTLLKAMALAASGLILPVHPLLAAVKARVLDLRPWTAPDHTRVVFDLDHPVKHTLVTLKNPHRVVLEIQDILLDPNDSRLKFSDKVVGKATAGLVPNSSAVRVVFELKEEVRPRSFILKADPQLKKGPRLVIDLFRKGAEDDESDDEEKTVAKENKGGGKESVKDKDLKEKEAKPRSPAREQRRKGGLVVAIDPGHGGYDPGAVGELGTREKDVNLTVGRKLHKLINAQPGFSAHLTRNDDYYVALKKRVYVARKHQPDLFISLHADAFPDRSARGASVYCLSERGKPSLNRAINELVKQQNDEAHLLGGIDLGDVPDPEVKGILMDLSQQHSLKEAIKLGDTLLQSLDNITRIKYDEVIPAGFMVLKAPDMPSVLVEMAFLTNAEEEALLRQDKHQDAIAGAIFEGVRRYGATRKG
ncbi:MAG: N-acetylmuramoyl-L-alanine amidase [Magnetococcales bacterium]|nr:N-acetylmuramoyl-L-alanine amidase [Magnetococcales bacterium]